MRKTVSLCTIVPSVLLLAAGRVGEPSTAPVTAPAPIHAYVFSAAEGKTVKDTAGTTNAVLKGDAKIDGGKLHLNNADRTSADGSLAYVAFEGAGGLLPKSGSATVVVWCTSKTVGAFSRLLDVGSGTGGDGSAFVYLTPRTGDDNARAAISATTTADKSYVDATPFDDGKAHMVALSIDGAAKKLHLYVDAKEVGEAADLGDNTLDKVAHDHAWLGRSAFDSDAGLTATVTELRVYDKALSAAMLGSLGKP